MLEQNNPNKEQIPIKQAQNNVQYRIYRDREEVVNNINTENNKLENDKTKKNKINNKKEEYSECKEFCIPDCCFCSESCCCNCSDYNIYPQINALNALIFTIISLSIILFILYLFIPQNHFDGHKIFSYIKKMKSDSLVGFYILFGVETFIYLPFVFASLPWSHEIYPSWAADECCHKIFECLTMILCCFCMFCCMCVDGCEPDRLYDLTSKCIRFLYKTAFYFYNIFFIPTVILYYCNNKDIKIEQKRVKWVFYVILSFLIIDIFSFFHVIIYGKKTNWKRNTIFGLLGFLVSFFIYKYIFEVNIYKYLLIPTAYYYIINNLFVYLMTEKWRAKLYPIYGSVGYLFVFLAIPILILIIILIIFKYCEECYDDCCNKVRTQKNEDSNPNKNNTPSVEEQVEEPFDENN